MEILLVVLMPQPRQYFERQIQSLDEIMKWLEEAKPKDRTITKLYAIIAEDRLLELHKNNANSDYKITHIINNYRKKIKPYLT